MGGGGGRGRVKKVTEEDNNDINIHNYQGNSQKTI